MIFMKKLSAVILTVILAGLALSSCLLADTRDTKKPADSAIQPVSPDTSGAPVSPAPPTATLTPASPDAPATSPGTPTATDTEPPSSESPATPNSAPPATPALPVPDNKDLSKLWERMDGSTATIPLTAALYNTISGGDRPPEHTTTPSAYYRLILGYTDLIIVTYPSDNEFEMARKNGVELEIIPVVKDALVFLVNAENPVSNVSQKQLRDIYTGKATEWNSVGGPKEPIIPYQRSADSGSQTLFLKLLMQGVTPMVPPTEWVTESMGGLVESVSYYDNAKSALGYSMFYYVNNMYGNSQFKLLGVDGVVPSRETIMRGEYPLEDCYYAVMRKDTPKDSPLRNLVDWLLTDAGQELAVRAGYIPIRPLDNVRPDDIDPVYLGDVYNSSGTGGTVLKTSIDDVVTAGVRRPLSDMFYDGFNYVRYINDEIMAYLNREADEGYRYTLGEEYQTGPFYGIPNDYPNFEISRLGAMTVFFPNDNPFFKPSGYWPNSLYIYIRLTEDISPYGEGLSTYTVAYDYGRRMLPNVDIFTLSIDIPEAPAAAVRINSILKPWAYDLPLSDEHAGLLEDFCAWYHASEEYPYSLQPDYGIWRDYLSVSYILQTYDGPAFFSPVLATISFDMNTGRTVDLAKMLPENLDYSSATIRTQLRFDKPGGDFGFYQEIMPEGYTPQLGYIINEAWVMYGRINLLITEPDGRALQVYFWDEIE